MRVDISLPEDLITEVKYRLPDNKTFSGLIQDLLRLYCFHGNMDTVKKDLARETWTREIEQRLSVLESQIR